jgi:hypothetical protein
VRWWSGDDRSILPYVGVLGVGRWREGSSVKMRFAYMNSSLTTEVCQRSSTASIVISDRDFDFVSKIRTALRMRSLEYLVGYVYIPRRLVGIGARSRYSWVPGIEVFAGGATSESTSATDPNSDQHCVSGTSDHTASCTYRLSAR